MAESVQLKSAWLRVLRWLEVGAPASRATLGPPASAQQVSGAARTMDVVFPEDLVALLRLNNGARNTEAGAFLFSGEHLLSVEEMVRLYRGLCGQLDTEELIGIWWHPLWVPFAASHDTVGCLFVDTRPGPGFGSVGKFFHESGGENEMWPSLAEFIDDMAGAIEDTRAMRPNIPRPPRAPGARAILPHVDHDALSWRQ